MLHKVIAATKAAIKKSYSKEKLSTDGWKDWSSYNYQTMFPDRYANQIKFTDEILSQYITPNDVAIELGCGDGWYTNYASRYFGHIDAYDLSDNFIQIAQTEAKRNNITNVSFYCQDARKVTPQQLYDSALCMGLFTYFMKDSDVIKTLNLLSKRTKPNSYLALKDSLNIHDTKSLHTPTYAALYRKEASYIALIEKANYKLLHSYQLSAEISDEGYVSMAYLFQKAS